MLDLHLAVGYAKVRLLEHCYRNAGVISKVEPGLDGLSIHDHAPSYSDCEESRHCCIQVEADD